VLIIVGAGSDVFALLGDLLSLCVPKEKVSKEKGHPASLSSANRRRSPARDASCAGAAELASLKQSSRNSRAALDVLGSAEGEVCRLTCRYPVQTQAFFAWQSLKSSDESNGVSVLIQAHRPVRYLRITATRACNLAFPRATKAS